MLRLDLTATTIAAVAAGETMTVDRYLRMHGFRIVARPKDGEPIWQSRTGREVSQSEALVIADKQERERNKGG